MASNTAANENGMPANNSSSGDGGSDGDVSEKGGPEKFIYELKIEDFCLRETTITPAGKRSRRPSVSRDILLSPLITHRSLHSPSPMLHRQLQSPSIFKSDPSRSVSPTSIDDGDDTHSQTDENDHENATLTPSSPLPPQTLHLDLGLSRRDSLAVGHLYRDSECPGTMAATATQGSGTLTVDITDPNTLSKPTSSLSKLFVFDFDSTLFRSPLPNPNLWTPDLVGALISDCGWFLEPRTLLAPFVPAKPDLSWWDESVLSVVQKTMLENGDDTVIVLLTGRRHDLFAERIKQLVQSLDDIYPVAFDIFFLKECQDPQSTRVIATTLDFKLAVLHQLLSKFGDVKHVEFWDDRKRHLDLFGKELKRLADSGRIDTFQMHHVVHDPELEKFMPEDLERLLVQDLVNGCNERIRAARLREEAAKRNAEVEKMKVLTETNGLAPEGSSPLFSASPTSSVDDLSASLTSNEGKSGDKNRGVDLPPTPAPTPAPNLESDTASTTTTTTSIQTKLTETELVQTVITCTEVPAGETETKTSMDTSSSVSIPTSTKTTTKAKRTTKTTTTTTTVKSTMPNIIHMRLGGLGATVDLKVVSLGVTPDKVVAVKVVLANLLDSDAAALANGIEGGIKSVKISKNDTPHVTMYVAAGASARESNDVQNWNDVNDDVPLILTGTVAERKLTGIKGKSAPGVTQKPKEVSIGSLVSKHHPHLKGKSIGMAVRMVEAWMAKGFMDNLSQNSAVIETFVANLETDPESVKKWEGMDL
ncbi:hypothetical protein HDU76_010112 [Blyttiomyces sp. JEL0837]|nr:hypothetical protein HDU76_010112 [Blyttiomyces sp. JEL0837]